MNYIYMKKTIFPLLAVVAGSVALSACEDQLDIPQKGVESTETFYKTDADAEKALASAYEGFLINTFGRTEINGGPGIYTPYRQMANIMGDDVLYAGGNYGDHEFSGALNEFRYDTENEVIKYHYSGIYLSVFTCNAVIEYFKNGTSDFQKQAVAEARVLRAYDYFLLANYWGTPPFVDHMLSGDAMPANSDVSDGMSKEDLIRWVATECEAAVPDLVERDSKTDKDGAVRVTKGFAYAMAGKAWLFVGEYAKAKDDLKKVIDSKKYDLVSGDKYLDMFHIEGDGNEEKVFELNLEYNSGISDWGGATWNGAINHSTWMEANIWNWRAGHFEAVPHAVYTGGVDGWGGLGVPKWFGDEFFANDGHSYRFDATLKHIDDVVYGMEYQDATINAMTRAEKEVSKSVGIKNVTEGLYDESFWLPFKQLIRKGDADKPEGGNAYGNNNRLNNIIVMRYAEVLLNYAEACIQTGDKAEALTYINKIQARAQKDGKPALSTEATMDVLKKEKSYELWLEGCRFLDILRWNDTEAIARLEKSGTHQPHLFDKLFRPVEKTDVDVIWENGTEANSRFYMTHTHAAMDANFEVGFKANKHYPLPFPQTVMDKNPNLRQNPGW